IKSDGVFQKNAKAFGDKLFGQSAFAGASFAYQSRGKTGPQTPGLLILVLRIELICDADPFMQKLIQVMNAERRDGALGARFAFRGGHSHQRVAVRQGVKYVDIGVLGSRRVGVLPEASGGSLGTANNKGVFAQSVVAAARFFDLDGTPRSSAVAMGT